MTNSNSSPPFPGLVWSPKADESYDPSQPEIKIPRKVIKVLGLLAVLFPALSAGALPHCS